MRFLPILALLAACNPAPAEVPAPPSAPQVEAPVPPQPAITIFEPRIKAVYPHRETAFTQGLFFIGDDLYESTGQRGESTIAKLDLDTGKPAQSINLPDEIFGEGAVHLNGKIFSLSWTSQTGFIHNAATLERLGTFSYPGQGWGLTTNGTHLIMSDGSATLRYLDVANFAQVKAISVRLQGQPVARLNELEYIDGQIYANIWQDDAIAIINPASGAVTGLIDTSALYPITERVAPRDDVTNGIAHNPRTGQLILTGKNWPNMFDVELVAR